jgi:hypothetical protein
MRVYPNTPNFESLGSHSQSVSQSVSQPKCHNAPSLPFRSIAPARHYRNKRNIISARLQVLYNTTQYNTTKHDIYSMTLLDSTRPKGHITHFGIGTGICVRNCLYARQRKRGRKDPPAALRTNDASKAPPVLADGHPSRLAKLPLGE